METEKIREYACSSQNTSGFSEGIRSALHLEFPRSYTDPDAIVEIAKAVQAEKKSPLCLLPFCNTVEAEAFGAKINLSDGVFGPRPTGYAVHSVQELSSLPPLDFSCGRLAANLEACRRLKSDGYRVAYAVSGFFSTMSCLMELNRLFLAWRKEPEAVRLAMDFLRTQDARYFAEIKRAGADFVSFADPAGSVSIIGPKYTRQAAEQYTAPLLREISPLLDGTFAVLLCPKTGYILLDTGLAKQHELDVEPGTGYVQACLDNLPHLHFAGQSCVKNPEFPLKGGKLRTLELV